MKYSKCTLTVFTSHLVEGWVSFNMSSLELEIEKNSKFIIFTVVCSFCSWTKGFIDEGPLL